MRNRALSDVIVKDATLSQAQNLFNKICKEGKKDHECDDLENNMSDLDFLM